MATDTERPRLMFSERYFIDKAFQEHCQKEGLAYCILNFLSWIQDNEHAAQVVRKAVDDH